MLAGHLAPLDCCDDCDEYEDGLDYRLYVDASQSGNVSSDSIHSATEDIVLTLRNYSSLDSL